MSRPFDYPHALPSFGKRIIKTDCMLNRQDFVTLGSHYGNLIFKRFQIFNAVILVGQNQLYRKKREQ